MDVMASSIEQIGDLLATFKNRRAIIMRYLINLGVLISGRGSNMDEILSSIKSGRITNVNPCVVISNKPEAPGLKIASERYGVTTKVIPSNGL